MRLISLSLRNYRLYQKLHLEFPDGLIGVYGPNGSGKSTLIEAIGYALYGDARTGKDELRTDKVHEDLHVDLVFEHEGNTYEVRRELKGQSLAPNVKVFRNGGLAVSSARDANAFLARVLGMDCRAFHASVCAQQKELTTFASMTPNDRRRLVLDLLGVSPVERALARVREETRNHRNTAAGARANLPDLEQLEQEAKGAAAELTAALEADASAAGAEKAAEHDLEAAREALEEAEREARVLDELRSQVALAEAEAAQLRTVAAAHDARATEADALAPQIAAAEAEVAGIDPLTAELARLEQARDTDTARNAALAALADARKRATAAASKLAAAEAAAEGVERLEEEVRVTALALAESQAALDDARGRYAAADARFLDLHERLEAAKRAVERSAALDPTAPCPTCGQPLGEAYSTVRQGHDDELAAARLAAEAAATAVQALKDEGGRWRTELEARKTAEAKARRALEQVANQVALAGAARQDLEVAIADVVSREAALAPLPDPRYDRDAHQLARTRLGSLQQLANKLAGLRSKAAIADDERRRAKEAAASADRADEAAAAARTRLADLGHLAERLLSARQAERTAIARLTAAHGEAQRTGAERGAASRRRQERDDAVAAARVAHDRVAVLEEDVAYLDRLTSLVLAFRLHLVSRLGQRLSTETERLFSELTDHEYRGLEVDPEDYSIRITDDEVGHELCRFSGSENDLASLALRVGISLVISERVGELGLLVLDEVLGSLDRDRRERMLAALTRLQGRFRQVLLVTHNEEVKDLLPVAIEVRKGPDRRATAALME